MFSNNTGIVIRLLRLEGLWRWLRDLSTWFEELFTPPHQTSPARSPARLRGDYVTQKSGSRRVLSEFRQLTRSVASGGLPQVSELGLIDDNIFRWRFCLSNFDNSTPGGRDLNADLAVLRRKYGCGEILMEALFPGSRYPQEPPLLRVIRPRMAWYTGHITAGGAVCLEALSRSSSPAAWQASYTMESILLLVMNNMVCCERVLVRTPTGPGGISGPARVDLDGSWSGLSPMADYSEREARAALERMEATHRRHGW